MKKPVKKKTFPPNWKGTAHLPATKPQLQTLHGLKRSMGMDDDAYRMLIVRHGNGVEHSSELTRRQASQVISEMMQKSGAAPAAAPAPSKPKAKAVTSQGNVVALATPPQTILIGHLVQEIRWHEQGSYEAWLKKNLGLDKIVTKEQARNAIEGLKGLKRHGHGH